MHGRHTHYYGYLTLASFGLRQSPSPQLSTRETSSPAPPSVQFRGTTHHGSQQACGGRRLGSVSPPAHQQQHQAWPVRARPGCSGRLPTTGSSAAPDRRPRQRLRRRVRRAVRRALAQEHLHPGVPQVLRRLPLRAGGHGRQPADVRQVLHRLDHARQQDQVPVTPCP